jgi:hypothetical protein
MDPPFLSSALGSDVWSFLPPVALPPSKGPQDPFDGRLDGLQSRSGRCGEQKNLLSLPGIEPRFLGSLANSPSLYRLIIQAFFVAMAWKLFSLGEANKFWVVEHRVLGRLWAFGEGKGQMFCEEPHQLRPSPDTVTAIRHREMKWPGN